MKCLIAITLAVALVATTTGRAQAMLAPVDAMGIMSYRDPDIQKIQTFLEQKEVSQKLAGYGFTTEEIGARLSSLSDAELHQIATRIDQQNPGGDSLGGVLVLVILVLLIVYLLKRV